MKKIVMYIALFLVCLSAVFAANTEILSFYDESGNPVNNVEVSVFQCTDNSCQELTGTSASDRIDYADTGSTNSAELSVPSTSTTTWYVAYAFAEETDSYLPRYYTFGFTGGTSASDSQDITLEKKDICRSTIQSFSVTNSAEPGMPIIVDVAAALEADTYSAFELTDEVYPYGMSPYTDEDGTVHVTAPSYNDWYSAETDVTLTITKEATLFGRTVNVIVYTDSASLNIQAEDSENVQFTWTPTTEGTYTATVTTDVTDNQCVASEEQSSSEIFTIVSEEDSGYCYTNINNLRVQEIEDGEVSTLQTGQTYTVTFDKISNAVADMTFTPLATDIGVAVYDEDANLDYTFSDTMDANAMAFIAQEYSFAWTPVSEGDNTITVNGVAIDCPYTTNNANTETLTIYVEGTDVDTNIAPVADAGGDILTGSYWSNDYDVTFDGSDSYDTDGYIVDYSWDFGDGTTGTGVNPTHTYTDSGTYTATLTVTDDDGATDSDTAYVRIFVIDWDFDTTPYVTCGGPYEGYVNEDITFDGYAFDIDGDSYTELWDFGDSATSTEEDPTHAYSAVGTYDVTFTVTDEDGNAGVCSTTATITEEPAENADPVAVCDIPATGIVNEDVTVDGSGSYDTDGSIVSYAWTFDSGLTSFTDAVTTTVFSTVGTYTATLTVTDDDGATNSCSGTIEITEETPEENEAPIASCVIPSTLIVGETGTFDGSGSSDSDGTIVSYAWDFGDSATDAASVATHAYSAEGSYTAALTVTDDDGATNTCSGIVVVTEGTPEYEMTVQIVANPTAGRAPLTVEFDEIITNGVEPFTYTWDLGDGNSQTAAEFSHIYTAAGTYTVTLTVTDADGETEQDTETITVEEDLPAVAVASANPTSGEPTLWVQFSSDGSSGDEPLSYYWTFGDGEGSSTRANPGHYYDKEGTYTATLTVTDADGDSDSDSVTITVGDELENIASRHYYVDGIAMSNDGRVKAGDTVELYVGAENIADVDKDSVAFNAIIQELGIYETTTEFDLDAGEDTAAVLYLDIPAGTEPGTYYVRITISDDYVKRVIYRDIIVTQ